MTQHSSLITQHSTLSPRELELAAIVDAYNAVTERLKESHEQLGQEVRRLSEELSRKNRQLRRSERLAALGELAAGVAHEIRNPLGGIRVFASLLRRDLADQPEPLRLVDKIATGVLRLERIVTDILEYGRPSEPQVDRVCIATLLTEVCELAMGKRPGTQVDVGVSTELVETTLMTDAGLLQRALLNLALNALEACEGGGDGRVSLRAKGQSGRIVIEVSDSGPGIPDEMRERIFNPFFTTKPAGTGLGLAIVHQTLETLGGTVTANNRPEGGAVFTVSLPVAAAGQESLVNRKRQRPPRTAAAKATPAMNGEANAAA